MQNEQATSIIGLSHWINEMCADVYRRTSIIADCLGGVSPDKAEQITDCQDIHGLLQLALTQLKMISGQVLRIESVTGLTNTPKPNAPLPTTMIGAGQSRAY